MNYSTALVQAVALAAAMADLSLAGMELEAALGPRLVLVVLLWHWHSRRWVGPSIIAADLRRAAVARRALVEPVVQSVVVVVAVAKALAVEQSVAAADVRPSVGRLVRAAVE